MTEDETIKAIYCGLADLLKICKNLKLTGPALLRIDLTEGRPADYGFIMEKKSCIRKNKDVR
jgi:hypothetical protein